MRYGLSLPVIALALVASVTGTVLPASARPIGSLQLSATLTGRVNQVMCPPQSDPSTACFASKSSGVVRGLGVVSETNLNFVEDADTSCERWHSNPVLTVLGKGALDLSVNPGLQCVTPTSGVLTSTLPFSITGGSGVYTGASGHGMFKTNGTPGTANRETDILGGSLSVPGLTFDLTPPTISGARSKTVTVPRGVPATRVRYSVTARDNGKRVPVSCRPASGSRFKVGRTRVRCRAIDTSGNVAKASFSVVVKRRG
jgi:hypothetical protein